METKDYKKEEYWKLVEEFVTELKTTKYWFENDGKPKKEWKLFETRDAAWDAAWDAASGAARDAAWDAASDAARDAASGAARDAAWDAAWDAASGAARGAAWDAAWDAGLFGRMLVCLNLKVDIKHLIHIDARMEVWRKGYGLLCDVDGVLYVYKRP